MLEDSNLGRAVTRKHHELHYPEEELVYQGVWGETDAFRFSDIFMAPVSLRFATTRKTHHHWRTI